MIKTETCFQGTCPQSRYASLFYCIVMGTMMQTYRVPRDNRERAPNLGWGGGRAGLVVFPATNNSKVWPKVWQSIWQIKADFEKGDGDRSSVVQTVTQQRPEGAPGNPKIFTCAWRVTRYWPSQCSLYMDLEPTVCFYMAHMLKQFLAFKYLVKKWKEE